MPAYKAIYDAADAVLQDFAIPVSQDGGTTYGPTTFHVWNDKGGTHGDATTLQNARLRAMVDNGVSRVPSGFPIEDEAWTQMAIVGFSNAGDPNFSPQLTGFNPVGANNPLLLPNIPKNCAIYVQVKIVVPAGITANITQDLYLEIVDDEATVVLALRLGLLSGGGVIPDFLDPSARRLRSGRVLSPAGSDQVTLSIGSFTYDGVPKTVVFPNPLISLNQNAADGALAVGQSYYARISQKSDGTVTTTKGNRNAAPVKPSVPANEINLGTVRVFYQVGGVSIIAAGDVDVSDVIYGEYYVYAGTGLNAKVGIGQALTTNDFGPFQGAAATVALADNATNSIWLMPDGTFVANTTGVSPAFGALKLGEAITVAGVCTGANDFRTFVGKVLTEWTMALRYRGPIVAVMSDVDWDILPFAAYLDSVDLDVGNLSASGGGAYNVKIDVRSRPESTSLGIAGTSIYTSAGSDDRRPSVITNIAVKAGKNILHEVLSFAAFTRFSFDFVAVPSAGVIPEVNDAIVMLHFRKK